MPKMFLSNMVLRDLLKQSTYEEKLSLTKILNKSQTKPYDYIKLQEEICLEGGHWLFNKQRGQGTGYLDILDDILDKLEISNPYSYQIEIKYFDEINNLNYNKEISIQKGINYALESEEKIIIKLLELIYNQLNDTQKQEFDKQVINVAKQFDSNASLHLQGMTSLMLLGHLGGFATYTFLTTSLSVISLGSLGFGAYTTATSLLSIVMGPIGWTGLGLAGIYTMGKPSYEKLIPIVAIIGTIRQRIIYEEDKGNLNGIFK